MTDEFDVWLASARPHTTADDGWAASEDGERTLAAIHRAATSGRLSIRSLRRVVRPMVGRRLGLVAASLLVIVAAAAGAAATQSGGSSRRAGPPVIAPPVHLSGPRPADMALAAYNSCADLLAGLRAHAERSVGPNGFPGNIQIIYATAGADYGPAVPTGLRPGSAGSSYSPTNVQEPGVDEPDVVKTDGSRIVSVAGGTLRVVDARTKTITGTLDLTLYANAGYAQLLVAGNRALVTLNSSAAVYDGPTLRPGGPAALPQGPSTYLLVELSGQPRVIATFRPSGDYLDARMVGSTIRLVVSSSPKITFAGAGTDKQRLARNRATVRSAPLSAWQPAYETTVGASTTRRSVPCSSISHPRDYTAASMLTVYTIDLGRDPAHVFSAPRPVAIAADGDSVYATSSSLYVASNPDWYPSTRHPQPTQLHRFDISGPGAPSYLGSGSVPGRLLSQYSMSDYHGHLRVATTTDQYSAKSATAVYVLDANTLTVTGQVGGLGRGQQVYAVRFLGPLGYVVTFRQVDPLYVIDLHDPTAPRVAGALELTGYSDYLHPVGDGRLIGVGQEATAAGRVAGLQVSLFDVRVPTRPHRIAHLVNNGESSSNPDPHAFLYWPATGLAVVPTQTWSTGRSEALVLSVTGDHINTVGTVHHPAALNADSVIQRSLVIGGTLWTLSGEGLMASDAGTLRQQAWLPFS